MRTLVTGASGFIGKLLVERLTKSGNMVYGLSRHPPPPGRNFIPLEGDVTEPNLGLSGDSIPEDIGSVYHLAAIHRLGKDKDGSIWHTNVTGTGNLIGFCLEHKIPHLHFCSTAYTVGEGRNT